MRETSALARALLLALLPCCFSLGASADEIKIPVGQQGADKASGTPRPGKGMSKNAVLQQFGEPSKKYPAVGHPPIERWDYDKFNVYFEYDHVVHSVLPGPAPKL